MKAHAMWTKVSTSALAHQQLIVAINERSSFAEESSMRERYVGIRAARVAMGELSSADRRGPVKRRSEEGRSVRAGI